MHNQFTDASKTTKRHPTQRSPTKRSSLRRRSHRSQELHGARRKKKRIEQQQLQWEQLQPPRPKRTTRYWPQCLLTGKKKRKSSLQQVVIIIHNSCMIAQQPTSVSWRCSQLQNMNIYLRPNRSLTNFCNNMVAKLITWTLRAGQFKIRTRSNNW